MTQESYTPLHRYQIAVAELLQINTPLQYAFHQLQDRRRLHAVTNYRNDFYGRWSSSCDLPLIERLLYFWTVSCFERLFVLGLMMMRSWRIVV